MLLLLRIVSINKESRRITMPGSVDTVHLRRRAEDREKSSG
jgi:hypothetical protein